MTTPDEILARIKALTKPADANSHDEVLAVLYAWQREILAHNAASFEAALKNHWNEKKN